MAEPILLLGATGLFGGHLARRLLVAGHDVILAARDEARLAAFATAHGGRARALDRSDPTATSALLAAERPAIVIDAAGPFQLYGTDPYRFARQVLNAGAHYLDLADAPAFVAGIGALDPLARARGRAALSGASTTPAISSAAADALTEGLDHVEEIAVAVMPGNRTERGLSVIRAILLQTGQPFRLWRGGRWQEVHGWDETRTVAFGAGGHSLRRLAALNATLDVVLFPTRYGARTVLFRAGLELGVLHHGLGAARWLVRLTLIPSLEPFARPAQWAAARLVGLGSNMGGMKVAVLGAREGRWERREWDLVAPDGVGPRIPAEPAALLAEKLLSGGLAPRAGPAMGDLRLGEIEAALAGFGVVTERRSTPVAPLFRQVLGDELDRLAPPVRALHDGLGLRRYRGRARIEGAHGWRARVAARIAGLPGDTEDTGVRVAIDADETREVWTRAFGSHRFRSVLRPEGAIATERFGPLAFALGLAREGGDLAFPVLAGRAFGLPLPRALVPLSETREGVDAEGRFTFDVKITLRSGDLVAHYRGWLVPYDQP